MTKRGKKRECERREEESHVGERQLWGRERESEATGEGEEEKRKVREKEKKARVRV